MRRLIFFFALALPLHADTLADVKGALARLSARAPLHATWSHESHRSSNGRFGNTKSDEKVAVDVVQDAQSLRVEVPRALPDKAADEERTKSGSWKNEARNAISRVSVVGISEQLDYADSFIGLLSLGSVTEEKRLLWNGIQTRMLVLQLKEPTHENEGNIGNLKYTEDRLNVWIGPDDIPLAAEHVRKATAGFLFLHGDTTTKRSWQFARKDDHFLVARYEDVTTFAGLGQRGEGRTLETIVVR